MKGWLWRFVGFGVAWAVLGGVSGATEFTIGGSPASLMGYVNQGVTYGIDKDDFNNKKGFNSAVFSALLEGDYRPNRDLKFYGAGKITADWAYPLLAGNDEWKDKEFDESRDEIYLDTGWNKMLHEAHVTWAPGGIFVRAGKQIVSWGETDGFRLMDQINPVDQRRGLGDVEFENTIIPLWLLRVDYYIQPQVGWLQDIGLETVFNPNAEFQANRPIDLGNDDSGIWAPNVGVGPLPTEFTLVDTNDDGVPDTPVPTAFAPGQLGSFHKHKEEPDAWDPSGFEFGARLKAVVSDTIVTLNYFNGLSNDAQLRIAGPPDLTLAPDGKPLLHLPMQYRYPRFRMAGATFTGDFPSLTASFLGGVAPVLRLEGFYGFQNTFGTDDGFSKYVQRDEVRYIVGVDWKVKASFLNPKAYFFLSGQFYHRKILDFDSDTPAGQDLKDFLGNVRENNYATSLAVNTTYFHNKLTPSFFWLRDISLNGNMYKFQLTYDQSDRWHYILGALLLDGNEEAKGFEPLKKKDQVFATIKYRF
ncbi:MAG: hypothetical protein HZB55_04910 [Deltaproteobacteria bacterium]|nr:hypothetical protein [Deltaproteobacteria bacterium]